MNDRKLQRKLQQLQLRSGRDVEITSSFHGSVIHLRNQPSAIYGAYRGPFSVILTGAENNLPPEILITDLSYNGNVRRAGEVKLFNARVIRVPETRLPLNDYLLRYRNQNPDRRVLYHPAGHGRSRQPRRRVDTPR